MVAPAFTSALTVECLRMERYVGTRILCTGEATNCTCIREAARAVQNKKTAAKMDRLDIDTRVEVLNLYKPTIPGHGRISNFGQIGSSFVQGA